MNPFFESDISILRLLNRAEMWYGSGFELRACDPFNKVDCIQLALDIYRHSHFSPAVLVPDEYRADWGVDERQELIEDQIKSSGDFLEIKPSKVQSDGSKSGCFKKAKASIDFDFIPGDLVLFNTRKVAHHVGVLVGYKHFIHSMKRHGVIKSHVSDGAFNSRIRSVWRPVVK